MVTPQNASTGSTANRPPQTDPDALKQQAGNAAQDLKDQAQQTASTAVDQVKETASNQLGSQKDRATAGLNGLADSLHQAGKQLESSDQAGFYAKYAHQAADRIQQLASHLDERDIDELVADVEGYARQQPAVFLGGAFLLGVLGARFLKSSSQRRSEDYGSRGYDSGSRLSDAYRGYDRGMGTSEADRSYGATYGAGTNYPTGTNYGSGSAYGAAPTYGSGSAYGAGSGYTSGAAASRPPSSAVRMTGASQPPQGTGAPRVDDAERLDALRRGDVPHQAAGAGTTPTTPGTQANDTRAGQSVRTGTGDTARNTETT